MILFLQLSQLTLFLLLSSHLVNANKTTTLNVLDKSGRLTIVNDKIGPHKVQNKVRIQIVSVVEVTGSGEAHGTGGPPHKVHSLESLDSQNFAVTGSSNTVVGGVKAEKLSLVTQVGAGGTVTLETYVFRENGTFSLGNGDSYTVKENDFKFNVRLSNWTFCMARALCGQKNATENTTYVDVAIEAKVLQGRRGDGDDDDKNKPPKPGMSSGSVNSNSDHNKMAQTHDGRDKGDMNSAHNATMKLRLLQKAKPKVDLGSNIPMYLSNLVEVDGVWVSMADGYPKEDSQRDGVRYVIRIPRFSNQAVYDPVVAYSAADQVTSGASNQKVAAWGALSVIFLVAVFA